MIELDIEQAGDLQGLFEQFFDDQTEYFTFVDIDEIFLLLIGGTVDYNFYDRLKETICHDENNVAFACFMHKFLESIITDIHLKAQRGVCEYWELANNCKILKDKIDEELCTPDSGNL